MEVADFTDLHRFYLGMGQPCIKAFAPSSSTDSTYEYYLRDVQGNLMASYFLFLMKIDNLFNTLVSPSSSER